MKLLLIGPYPPPHGGISVHIARAQRELERAGIACRVLNLAHGRSEQAGCLPRPSLAVLPLVLLRHARSGWTLHLHTNGHNLKSWITILLCGLAGRFGHGALLTLHSGLAPQYMQSGSLVRRSLLRLACACYTRIVCVNPEIEQAVAALGIPRRRLEILPAFLDVSRAANAIAPDLAAWVDGHSPVFSTTLFFRPEYGFDLLLEASARLRRRHPKLGWIVMGDGEQREQMLRLVERRSLSTAVLMLGDVPHEKCLALIARSSVFVRPTLQDGDAISVREALSLDVPVVASDVGKRPPEALLFRRGDIEDLITKIELALAQPGRAGGRPSFQPGLAASRLLEIYARVAA